ncbi:uncharacterized protein LOC111326340 [Stylophora pistillata]|uniref:uncharacterized protein LOC111326340 n=1 Tax=Stylophora pistillata TaxID=50429 RepID=UPI000C03DF98|nr:uncharacterized protein LOC111326340 [Stylophora pistillata]
MMLKLPVLLILVSLLSKTCRSSPAKPLLRFDEENGKFTLSEDALPEIQSLKGPVRIVGAIGDARVGKSTNLNFIRYFLEGERNQRVEKVFNTSDGMKPCTTGVWMSVSRDSNGDGSTILLDTEGTNLGDNENTDLLSIFTMMMSSGLALFAREAVQNHKVQFLYRVSRLSEQIWKDDAESRRAFPQLLVIIRNALAPSPGKTLQSQTQDSILDGNYGETIAKHFPRINIKVRDIPFVDSKRLRDLEQFTRDDYANVATSLASDLRSFPLKKTVHGANIDGTTIASLAKRLEIALNQNSRSGFSNTYTALETELCDRFYQNIIEPFLRNNLNHMRNGRQQIIDEFTENCALGTERTKIRDKVDEVIAQKEEMAERERRLDTERRRKEEAEKMEKEREEQRRREAREKEKRLEEERRAAAKAEEEQRIQEENLRTAEEDRIRLEEEAAARRAKKREKSDIAKAIIGGVLLFGICDSRLKENITVVPHSDYEQIGVRSYNWVWSKDAVELGMSGTGRGVIAQEVEELYPWTVVMGDDGYKSVDYEALKQMVMENKTDYCFITQRYGTNRNQKSYE